MLFFTSGRGPSLRRTRRDLSSWLDGASSIDPESAMKDAGAAMRHVGGDIAEAARDVGGDIADAARDVSGEAARQIRSTAGAVRAGASAVPDDLLPAARDAIGKSVQKLLPDRRKRSRRRPLLGVLAALTVTGLALLGVQMLLARRSSLAMARRNERTDDADEPTTGPSHLSSVSGQTISARTGIPSPISQFPGPRPPDDVAPDAVTEPATFDRDAGIRAASEGMEPPEPLVPGFPHSEIADGT